MKLRVYDRCEVESRLANVYVVSTGYSAEWVIFLCRTLINLGFVRLVLRRGLMIPRLTLNFVAFRGQ